MTSPSTVQILVIGGAGFIGPYLVDHLVRGGHRVTVFHRGQSRVRLPEQVGRTRRGSLSRHSGYRNTVRSRTSRLARNNSTQVDVA